LVGAKGWKIITDKIDKLTEEKDLDGITVHFTTGNKLNLGYIAVLPDSWSPHDHAASLLTPSLLGGALTPMASIAAPDIAQIGPSPVPPRMGDDPRTATPGLFWAGSAGGPMANVNVSVAQGQAAAFVAADELGREDVQGLMKK
jgi:hypothetical protein